MLRFNMCRQIALNEDDSAQVNRSRTASFKLSFNFFALSMRNLRFSFFLFVLLFFISSTFSANANTYMLTPDHEPAICSGNQGTWSQNTYICNWGEPLQLAAGDIIISQAPVTIVSRDGMNLTDVTIGDSVNPINLQANGGSTIQLNNTELFGSIIAGTPNANLTNNTVVHGSVTVNASFDSNSAVILGDLSASNGVAGTNLTVNGSIMSSNGLITINGGAVGSSITSGCCVISLTNVDTASGSIGSDSDDVFISGGTINSNITSANDILISGNATINGDITARETVDISDSVVIGNINVLGGTNTVDLMNSTVFGNVTVLQSYGTITGNWPDSVIYGDCEYSSVTPSSLCTDEPPPIDQPGFCEEITNATSFGIVGQTGFTYGNNSVINTNEISGVGNTPTPIGQVTSVELNLPALEPESFPSFSSTQNRSNQNIGPGTYNEVEFRGANNTFSMDAGTYFIKQLELSRTGNGVVLNMGPGDYFIEDLIIHSSTVINVTGEGAVRLFIKNGIGLSNASNVNINSFGNVANFQVLLYEGASVSLGTGNQGRPNSGTLNFNGLIYGPFESNNVSFGNNNNIQGSILVGGTVNVGNNTEFNYSSEVEAAINESFGCDDETLNLICTQDSFESTSGFPLLWQTSASSGSFTPRIQNGRLRLNQATNDQATVASLRRAFPAANNYIEVEFDFSAYAANNFDGSVGGDGISVVFSDASVVPVPGSYGGSLGYAQRAGSGVDGPGFAGGWLGVGIDIYGNFSQATEGRVGGRTGGPRTTRNRVALRGAAETDYEFITNSEQLSGMSTTNSTPPDPDRYRIVIDSRDSDQSLITVLRRRPGESNFVEVIPEFDVFQALEGQQPAVPDLLRLSFTGSSGGAFSVHEIDDLEVCALQSQPLGVVADHYRLSHSGELVSCFSETIEITACANADCSEVLSQDGTIEIQATQGTWLTPLTDGPNATIPLNQGVGVANLSLVSGGTAGFDLLRADPPTVSNDPFRCYIGSINGPREECNVTFKTAGLAFVKPDNIDVRDDRSSYAGAPLQRALRTVETNTTTGACEARVEDQTLPVDFSYQCLNPGSCNAGQRFALNGNDISFGTATPVSVEFDDRGVGLLEDTQYSDVGQIQLSASLSLPEWLPDPAVKLTGNSLPFVSVPHTLQALALNEDDSVRTQPNTADPAFKAAGDGFPMVIRSLNAQGELTPNFGNESLGSASLVELDRLETVYPEGGVDGELSVSRDFERYDPALGSLISPDVTWSEVGTFSVRAKLTDNNYLGAGDAFERPIGLVGRFFPATFKLTDRMVSNSCTDFTYMDEPNILIEYVVEAQNTSGRRTENYTPGYAGLASLQLIAVDGDLELSDRILENSDIAEWNEGAYTFFTDQAVFTKLTGGSVDGPFNHLQLGIEIDSERDNRRVLLGGEAFAAPLTNAIEIGSPLTLRHGRLRLSNTLGPEGEALQVIADTEVWDGSRFVRHFDDSCTELRLQRLAVAANPEGLDLVAGSDRTPLIEQGRTPSLSLFWETSTPQIGEFEFSYDLSEAPWLRFDWEGNGLTDPMALGSFGVFRGNDRIIYLLERRLQ